MHFSRFKALLKLNDEAMELADRYCIDEKKLRFVISLPSEYQIKLVHQIIDLNLTSKQVKEICDGTNPETESDDKNDPQVSHAALRIARATKNTSDLSGVDLARALVKQEHDVNLARARLQIIRRLIDEAEQHLQSQ